MDIYANLAKEISLTAQSLWIEQQNGHEAILFVVSQNNGNG